MFSPLKQRWHSPGGYRQVLTLAIPLVITTSITGVQSFIDRLLLSWYSTEALAATVPSSMVCITLSSVFMGIASYIGVFVAQFYGAEQYRLIGKVVWQGVYISLLSLLMVVPLYFAIAPLFAWIDHAPSLQAMEIAYAEIQVLAIPVLIVFGTLSGFFSGLGKVTLVMWVNALVTLANLLLDYFLIFDREGHAGLGVVGASWATFIAYTLGSLLLFVHFLRADNRVRYGTQDQWRLDRDLFRRLLRFGVPVGLQMQLETLAWTIFVLLVGAMGVLELSAHSIAMSIFMLVIMPMAGISVAVSVLVGQNMGAGNFDRARRVTESSLHLGLALFALLALMMVFSPDWMMSLFAKGMSPAMQQSVSPLVHDLLLLLAIYCPLMGVSMILSGTLRGAGDTAFVARSGIAVNWLVLVSPVYLWGQFVGTSLRMSWLFLVLSGAVMCWVYVHRYRQERWTANRLLS